MNHRTPAWAPIALAISIACSGAGPSPTTTNQPPPNAPASPPAPSPSAAPVSQGTTPAAGSPGLGFDAKSAIHGVGPAGTIIVLSDAPDLCATLSQQSAGGLQALGAGFLRVSIAGTPPGTFSGTAANAELASPGRVAASVGGAVVELEAESPDGRLSGTYDLGELSISGQFTSDRCEVLAAEAGVQPSSNSSPSCSTSLKDVNGRSDFDERCTSSGQTTARQCTLSADESSWSCLCTAPSGTHSTCQAQVAQPNVVSPPPSCCSGG